MGDRDASAWRCADVGTKPVIVRVSPLSGAILSLDNTSSKLAEEFCVDVDRIVDRIGRIVNGRNRHRHAGVLLNTVAVTDAIGEDRVSIEVRCGGEADNTADERDRAAAGGLRPATTESVPVPETPRRWRAH